VHTITGASFDLNSEALTLLDAVAEPRTFAELQAGSGLPVERAHKLLDQAVNRGLVRALVDAKHVTWIPEAAPAEKVLA
jgi:DNA-binding IclR family transcriptional regulator